MRRLLVPVSLITIILLIFVGTQSDAQEGGSQVYLPVMVTEKDCWPNDVPAGALPGQPPPVFCLIHNDGPDTAQAGANTWSDDFNHGLSFANFDQTQYRTFDNIGAWRTIQWRHADHWMIDLAPHPPNVGCCYTYGYAMLSPNQSFTFAEGKLVVETTVAAGMQAYGMAAWPEIVVSTAPAPVQSPISHYAFDLFPEGWTLGCRLQASRYPVCALKANDGTPTQGSTRIWEMSAWQLVGTESFGGYPFQGLENYWRECALDEPDINCRDHFRLELTETSLKLFVNDGLYFSQTGIPPLPDGLLNGNIYVYLASSQVDHPADTIRFHWDNLLVNPDLVNNTLKWRSIINESARLPTSLTPEFE